MTTRAVFFDAGETLLGPDPSFAVVYTEVLRGRGVDLTVEDVEHTFANLSDTFTDLFRRSRSWSTSRELSRRFWGEFYRTVLGALEIPDPDGGHFEALYRRFTRFDTYRLFPDAIPTIERLRSSGLVVGLISNFEAWLEEMLAEMKVADLLDVVTISGKEGVQKPEPEIFHRAIGRAGVDPDEALYVGDNPRDDIEGAESVGMSGVLIDRRGHHPDFAGRKIQILTELPELIGLG